MSPLTASLLRWVSVSLLGLFAAASADTDGTTVVKIIVTEGDDVMLPCSMTTKKDLRDELFDWKKGRQEKGRQKIFLYAAGSLYGHGREGQDPQYEGRVSHFEDQLQYSNASILIRNTQINDRGIYICVIPHLLPGREVHIELVVEKLFVSSPGPRSFTVEWVSGVVTVVVVVVLLIVLALFFRKRRKSGFRQQVDVPFLLVHEMGDAPALNHSKTPNDFLIPLRKDKLTGLKPNAIVC